mmetsp:Transcript_13191/g.33219  ORF Transcript_13191/g.33219 Transcript_13191/m.33219 type:complete len:647 (+) Transcript_13191:92-2032(+)|eukprot:CAMPEP_0116089858 /NCGR_PEP_ID=MMETSP0327-20121206/6643_1 /TAXON_ID=44447 /ORGANISM="Pseudo-nitzschia delicatissima, Strain B596" /LENGTH=646 /DNA_ID=CAMNT_0003581065 /DNA_START=105 /DNA_END=2048 /DNA_ORIENTATION=-
MSATVRGSKSPPGRRYNTNGTAKETQADFVSAAVNSCANSTCCMGDAESGLKDDKYRKRLRQRKQIRLRNGLLFLTFAMVLLVFTVYQLNSHPVRLARKGEHPKHKGYEKNTLHNQHRERKRKRKMHALNDDHNKDDANDDKSESGDDEEKEEEEPQKHSKGWFWNHNNKDVDDESNDEEALMQRRLLELDYLSERMNSNTNTTIRWADMSDVPPLPGREDASRNKLIYSKPGKGVVNIAHNARDGKRGEFRKFFQIHRPASQTMKWEEEFEEIENKDPTERPDYVNYVHHEYNYPEMLREPPKLGNYPYMRTYKELMDTWPQDNIDNPPDVLQEDLLHFDWNSKEDMEAAVKFREAKLPFKVINVPEVMAATEKWTDEYLSNNFDTSTQANGIRADGKCNEGPDNFFAFFNVPLWGVLDLGIPPTRDNDWTYKRWAQHSLYADRVGLHPHQPHYYWQSGVPKEERFQKKSQWSFVSRDLPSFSSTEDNFILFHAKNQKGIQCRFGERGITAANHYDSGRNMIAMITGAKRYILSPPRACKRLGVVSNKGHASFRHSMLNYGHLSLVDIPDIPAEEKEWLEMVGSAEAVSTVLKEGEILYVPTGWFHYITSLQKSAQCNVRSGPDMDGDNYWGGANEIRAECFPHQ